MEGLNFNSQQERVAGIPDDVLNQAILIIAGHYNPDLKARAEEIIIEGGDALTFLGGCIPGSSKDAISLAQQIKSYHPE